MGWSIDTREVTQLAARMDGAPATLGPAVGSLVTHHTALLQTRMMRHASGRPGPNVRTGDFRRSITHDVQVSGLRAEGAAGSGAPQAARLENGFVGADSLGRVYHQPPYPWARPAAAEAEPEFVDAMINLAASVGL